MKKVLMTGASRGIGLEMSRQLVEAGEMVFATCRNPEGAAALQSLATQYPERVVVVQMDVGSDESVAGAKTAVSQQTDTLDWIINNAGINLRERFEQFNAADMLDTFNINTVGAMRVVTTFVEMLNKSKAPKIGNISSQLGSLQKARAQWGTYGYNASKAAMNMITRHLSFDLADQGAIVISVHPGWVQTDMGGQEAAVTVPDSAAGILQLMAGLTVVDNGKFYTYQGVEHPW